MQVEESLLNPKIAAKLDAESVEEALSEGREWLEENDKATKSEILAKKKEIERKVSAIMAKLFS